MNTIEIQNVNVSHASIPILRDINLEVKTGTLQGIIGPSGAGKTTFLKLLNGLIKPTQGSISIFNKPLTPKNVQKIRPQIGYIPQNMGLIQSLTVNENILLGALARSNTTKSLFKIFPKQEVELARELQDFLGISTKSYTQVKALSGGEKRRVAIARALMQKPKLLLADEILSDLDCIKANVIMQKIKKLQKDLNLTIIMIEHNLCTAHEFSDHIAFLKEGALQTNISTKSIAETNLLKLFQ